MVGCSVVGLLLLLLCSVRAWHLALSAGSRSKFGSPYQLDLDELSINAASDERGALEGRECAREHLDFLLLNENGRLRAASPVPLWLPSPAGHSCGTLGTVENWGRHSPRPD